MAYSFATTDSGLALMRQRVSNSEWFFVQWLGGNLDVIVDEVGENTTWRYAVWIVLGADAPYTSIDYNGTLLLVVQHAKR
jgi:hypothetical protein